MNHTKKVVITAGAIVLLQASIGIVVYLALPDWTSRGQFGDVFGVANALFSGLAFAGLVYAILLQREDLQLQREELSLTRKELQRSAQAQELSEQALRAQASASERSARLNAINFLLEHYEQQLTLLRREVYRQGDPRIARRRDIEARQTALKERLEQVFDEIAGEHDDGQVQGR
ncbi:MAG TPA: hypothetical protein VJV79_30675 [Polyangiaceae bacterium]|nr:hypothetical protein [Polyangiaceae bacterium]